MLNMSRPALKAAYHQLGILSVRRREGNHSEDEIAQELGFHTGDAMHKQLKNLELPDWLVFGDPPTQAQRPAEEKSGRKTEASEGEAKRKARSGNGEVTHGLPSLARATELFLREISSRAAWKADKFDALMFSTLEDDANKLCDLKENLHGERFTTAWWVEDDYTEQYHKSMFSGEEWKEVWEEYGVGPGVEHFYVPREPYASPLGAKLTPWKGLVHLIAVYTLRNGFLDPLLEALHPAPSTVDREGLKKDIEKLRHYAERIARRVRGSIVRAGSPTEEVSSKDLWIKWSCIDPPHREGKSDQQILDELKAKGVVKENYPLEEVIRLRWLNLPAPD